MRRVQYNTHHYTYRSRYTATSSTSYIIIHPFVQSYSSPRAFQVLHISSFACAHTDTRKHTYNKQHKILSRACVLATYYCIFYVRVYILAVFFNRSLACCSSYRGDTLLLYIVRTTCPPRPIIIIAKCTILSFHIVSRTQ